MSRNSKFESPEEEMEYKLEIARQTAISDLKKIKSDADRKKKNSFDSKITFIALIGSLILLGYAYNAFISYW